MKRGTPDHWKMRELARLMKVPVKYGLAWANGTLERLWHYTAKYHPQGDIGKARDEFIASACGWPETDAMTLVDALVAAKWLDRDTTHRLLVHDWAEHCDDSVKKTLKRNGLAFFCPDKVGLGGGDHTAMALSSKEIQQQFPEGFDMWATSILDRWGKIKNRILGEQALSRLFLAGFSREIFESNYESWCAYHEKLGWQFAPPLCEWISDGGHRRKAPPIPKKTTAQNEIFGGSGGE